MKAILDACCGSRMFWFDRRHPDVVFMDCREETHTLCDGRTLEIKPDVVGDFRECFRVLEPGGVLVFKWCEDQVSTAEVLKLASHEPLFGHRRGKTVFLVFMKPSIFSIQAAERKKNEN